MCVCVSADSYLSLCVATKMAGMGCSKPLKLRLHQKAGIEGEKEIWKDITKKNIFFSAYICFSLRELSCRIDSTCISCRENSQCTSLILWRCQTVQWNSALEFRSNWIVPLLADKCETVSNDFHGVCPTKGKHSRVDTKICIYFLVVIDFNLTMWWHAVSQQGDVKSKFLCCPECSRLGMCCSGRYQLSEGFVDGRHTRHERRLSQRAVSLWEAR